MASPGQAQTLRLLKPPQHNPTEDDSPAPELQPWTTGAAIAGQLELELDMSEQAVDQLREAVETSNAA